jgi:excisionase family DNA binding protein
MDGEEFLTAAQAAEKAGVSLSSIYEACRTRRLAHYKVSGKGRRGKILIRPEDLQAFIESQRVEASKPLPPLKHIRLPPPS